MCEKMLLAIAVAAVSLIKVIVLSVSLLHEPVNLAVAKEPPPPTARGNELGLRSLLAVSTVWTTLAIRWASRCRN